MHFFNIINFKSATLVHVREYLFHHPNPRYRIIIPKKEFDNDEHFTRWQYYMAAHAGNLLSLVSTSFSYNVPCPFRNDPFEFHIEYLDDQKLAIILFEIISGYYANNKDASAFQDEAFRHFDRCFQGKSESACWGLLHLANKKFP